MNNRLPELAPCGVYCAACPSFEKSCKGCSSEDRHQSRKSKWSCKIRSCCYAKDIDYCIDCEEFPCKKLHKKLPGSHLDDPRFTYRHEIPAIFPKLKSMTIPEYLEFQQKRWLCAACGGTVKFYHYTCDTCGKQSIVH